ncbi:uncharacterized protein LOC106646690 [Copidosoma floridanum]|uniref:uncharacterized protein LOC106646690 n=1 Tax=Copidosoma floridanum TaxID=29053 RepID=UPI0006C9DFEE|nr:uncharacterized protein LOC106646690 [Copidosoma floridanum]
MYKYKWSKAHTRTALPLASTDMNSWLFLLVVGTVVSRALSQPPFEPPPDGGFRGHHHHHHHHCSPPGTDDGTSSSASPEQTTSPDAAAAFVSNRRSIVSPSSFGVGLRSQRRSPDSPPKPTTTNHRSE